MNGAESVKFCEIVVKHATKPQKVHSLINVRFAHKGRQRQCGAYIGINPLKNGNRAVCPVQSIRSPSKWNIDSLPYHTVMYTYVVEYPDVKGMRCTCAHIFSNFTKVMGFLKKNISENMEKYIDTLKKS